MRLANAAWRHWHDLPGEHAGAIPLHHTVCRRPSVGVVHADADEPRRRAVLLIRLDTTDKTDSA
jgi:hypothetical protein